MPLVWVGRMRGHKLEHRVYGPDLFLSFCRETQTKGYRHFFYGGAPGVPEALAATLREQFPVLEVAGTYSPPFRPLTPEEDSRVVEMIHQANADVLWVGWAVPNRSCGCTSIVSGCASRFCWGLGKRLTFMRVVCGRLLAGCVNAAWNGCFV